MISFVPFGGDPRRKLDLLDRLAGPALSGQPGSLFASLSGSDGSLAAAHQATGFPAPLLQLLAALHDALPADQAAPFVRHLLRAAPVCGDVADVADCFLHWLLVDALALHGEARLRASAPAAGPHFAVLAQVPPARRQDIRLAQRKGKPAPGTPAAFVAQALLIAGGSGRADIGLVPPWIAGLRDDPASHIRQQAARLQELVAAA